MNLYPPSTRPGFVNYALVTLAYWGFTITDGALRMLVLLYFIRWATRPLEVAMLFLFYEIFGIVDQFIGRLDWARVRVSSSRCMGALHCKF